MRRWENDSPCVQGKEYTMSRTRKVTIVGAGNVGASFAYALMQSGDAEEIVLTDASEKFARGQALDLAQGKAFVPEVDIHVGTDADFADSDLIVITAGAKQAPGETRLDLLRRNAGIISDITRRVAASGSNGVMMLVSNPVDILTKIAADVSDWPRERVIGSGTVLDTARFRHALAACAGIDARNVHGYILGEHGDSEFAAWSLTTIAGQPPLAFCSSCPNCEGCVTQDDIRESILKRVRDSAYEIISDKGSTYYAIGLAMCRIAKAILRDERAVLPVSVSLDGEYGLSDVALSVPCVVGRSGVRRILNAQLSEDEQKALAASGARLRSAITEIRGTSCHRWWRLLGKPRCNPQEC